MIGSLLAFLAKCAFGSDFRLCPVPMCSFAVPFVLAFSELVKHLVFGLEVVLGVDVEEKPVENPAFLAQVSQENWSG